MFVDRNKSLVRTRSDRDDLSLGARAGPCCCISRSHPRGRNGTYPGEKTDGLTRLLQVRCSTVAAPKAANMFGVLVGFYTE